MSNLTRHRFRAIGIAVSLIEHRDHIDRWNRLPGRPGVKRYREIYAKSYQGKVFLWWESPETQVDDFVYFGDRDLDIDDCKKTYGNRRGYTWHHTRYPHEEHQGTMQLVPTDEHEALPHVGGIAISQGKI